ncbi:hypothetical protein BWQ96_01019 [Gracilariopsis chorda]|uniref:NAD(P)-binding domain-containing protein n=1 Tax=Gracilariopsis chorda TaxID=448386 RepID=A0A2V3J7E6_9FLOR|nr:hypothetical protein BWQ96_01019 [Gracilariopsis chorda]|eukprot:PXF49230.1 hypothetical protein BWQ96_01019 [Gracilariopsis chorda]
MGRPRASADPPKPPKNIFTAARDFLSGIRRATGLTPDSSEELFDLDRTQLFEDSDQPPEVLVVGATGETGRIIVRKLVLRGYNVRVLVRNLYSSTLDLLGTGVSFVKGSLDDYDSLLEATGDVDKVICAVGARNLEDAELVEYEGVSNLIRAFHDSRVQYYGRSEATKRTLFNFGNEEHLAKWKRVVPSEGFDGARPPRVNFQMTGPSRVAFMGHVYSTYSGQAEIRTVPARVNLRGFSGFVLRCIGDGKNFFLVLRTSESVKNGVEYVAELKSHMNKWESVRIALSSFKPFDMKDGTKRRDAPQLDRGDIRQIAIQYRKPVVLPEKDDGRFYLGVDYLKVYRTQEQPDFVLVSCASVTARDFSELDEGGLRMAAKDDVTAWKYLAENRLRNSGLTYCIVRPGSFTDQPGGNKAIMLEQDGDVSGAISRADVAEICVKSLLDPRACNVTFDAFESMYAPSAMLPREDVSSMLGRLRPNT